jgi:DNA-binding PadR family transcriptional regulator
MKRDIDLVREILLSFEADGVAPSDIEEEILYYHLHLMIDAGLLNSKEISEGQWQIYSLTWKGHELLELIRPPTRWQMIKNALEHQNCYSFEIIKQIAIRQMKL